MPPQPLFKSDFSVWHALEQLPGLAAVPGRWRELLGPHFEPFARRFLVRSGETARSFPCPRQCGCWHEVIHHGPADLVAVCRCEPWRCDDLVLAPADVELWRLHWPGLARALCGAFGLDSKLVSVGLAGTRQIGSWSAEAVPALATFQSGARGLREVALALAVRLRGPFILLGASARLLDMPAREMLAGVGAQFFGLDTCVAFGSEGELVPLRTPGELFARFSPKAAAELEENGARSAFMLVKALEGGQPAGKAPLYTVFRLYCVEGQTIEEVARRCRCARSLVCLRLRALRQKLGADLRSFRRFSSQFEAMEASLTDSRARRINRYESAGKELG